ncbi:hypothetical protein J6590_073263 [Homalodisca vitripennis]|nr:hypothetical protein J6590_073263 [Homalodisca vitripennis]
MKIVKRRRKSRLRFSRLMVGHEHIDSSQSRRSIMWRRLISPSVQWHGAVQQAAVDCREARVVMVGGVIHQQWVGEGEAAVNPVPLIAGTARNTISRFMYGTTPC